MANRHSAKRPPAVNDDEQCRVILAEYEAGASANQLAKKHGTNGHAIAAAIRRAGGVPRKLGEFTKAQLAERAAALGMYRDGATTTEVGAAFGHDHSWARNVAKEADAIRPHYLSFRKYELDDDAFALTNDSPELHYWVGFIMADGCVYARARDCDRNCSPCLSLALSAKDKDHVVRLQQFCKSTHPVVLSVQHGYGEGKEKATLQLYSPVIAADLARFGVLPDKTHRERVIGLENDRDFWRGMVDGDGWIVFNRRQDNSPVIGLCGGLPIIEQFAAFVRAIIPGCASTIKPDKSIWSYSVSGENAAMLVRQLYENAAAALPRKAEVAAQAMLWRRRIRDLSRWTAEALKDLKEQHGSWTAVGNLLGMSAADVANLYHRRRNRPFRGRWPVRYQSEDE